MKKYRSSGEITVFLSLISVLFLSLLCTAIESARIQGARAKAAASLDMGLFSVFGEYENRVLEDYDVFFLDGAYGSGNYSIANMEEKLEEYMAPNISPNEDLLFTGYDPFGLQKESSGIKGVALATDGKGAGFYQQAVGFMHENLAEEAVTAWLERKEEGSRLDDAGKNYEEYQSSMEEELKRLQEEQKRIEEEQKRQREQEEAARKAAMEENGMTVETESSLPAAQEKKETLPDKDNPLEVIGKIRKKGILGLVLGPAEAGISDKKLSSDRPSARKLKKGKLSIEKKYGGIADDLLFQEYLFRRFPLYTDHQQKNGIPDYALEYILCGKNTDEKNLKAVITRLLLLREGANFAYLCAEPARRREAEGLALLVVGAIPVPGLQAATASALMLAWAYAESLVDLRILLSGGKVPVMPTPGSWHLDLTDVPDLLKILDDQGASQTEGLDYEGYLQILFTMGSSSKYPMRALDLIEADIRNNTSNTGFRADHAVIKAEASADFTIPPVFLCISNAFLRTGTASLSYSVSGTFSY